jgi:T5SS/PEP-CTERM-associated repeat protein
LISTFIVAFTLPLFPKNSCAQYTASYETNVISGVVSNWSGDYDIGNNTVFDRLQIISGGVLSNNGYGEVGLTASANNNSALVTGAGSLWNNTNTVFVGDGGSDNSLTIANGGQVVNTYGYIGNAIGSSGNSVLVTDTGSTWSNTINLLVGVTGSGNSLTISNGGQVFSYDGQIGLDRRAQNNTVLVTGVGSTWNNASDVQVGPSGWGNSLTIANAGKVVNENAFIGLSASSSNDSALVTGSGSLWVNTIDLFVGYAGPSNKLDIDTGGAVLALNAYVGFVYSNAGNQITISGGGLCVTNASFNSQLDVRSGALVLNSGTVTVDTLIATNGSSSVIQFNGGTLNTKATLVKDGLVFSVGNGTTAATLNLDNGGSGFHFFANGLSISSNAMLKGNGTIIGATIVNGGGTLSPGSSPGSMTFSNTLTLAPNATLLIEMAGYAAGAGGYDQVLASTATVTGASLQVQLLGGFVPTNGAQFTILDNFGTEPVGGTFLGASEGSTNSLGTGILFGITYEGNGPSGDANDIILTVVPEPATRALCLLGLIGVFRSRRRPKPTQLASS